MSESTRTQIAQSLREAEGYLELNLPEHALTCLERINNPGTFRGQVLYLKGEALRSLGRHADALEPLTAAADLAPSNIHIWLALGWCLKRTSQLDGAIRALEQALEAEPRDEEAALVTYNLACYLSLAGEKQRALTCLAKACAMNSRYRDLAQAETDFDPIRSDPDFQSLVSIIV